MAVDIFIPSQILTFADFASFPASGTVKTLYIAEDTKYQYYWDGTQYVQLTADFEIPANLIFYSTTAASDVAGYTKLVISIDDPDYNDPAVDVPTGTITTTGQLLAELVADAGIFAGNPGVINISTIGEIRRTSGSGTAEFYFEVYQRDSLGVETLRGTSNKTAAISGSVYQQFQADCLFNNGTWLATDRVVIKYYADRVGAGSNPNYDFLFGGANPVRTLFPISAQLLLNVPISIGITSVTGGVANEVLLTDGSGKLGQSELKTVGGQSLFGSGDITVGGGITIGTTAIASGTVNRILFEGAGNVVQQDSAFVWNNTDKRLILGTEASADANTRLVITGSGSGSSTTTFGLKVHNSTGTNNALVVRDDGNVGIGTNSPDNLLTIVGDNTSNVSHFNYKRTTNSILEIGNANTSSGGVLIRARQISSINSNPLQIDATCQNANDTYNVGTSQILIKVQRAAEAALSNKPYLNLRNGDLNRFTFAPMQTPTGITAANSTCFAWHSGAGSSDQLVTPEVNSMGEMQIRVTTNPTPVNFNLRNYFTTTNATQVASAPFLKFSGGYWNGSADVRVNSSIRSVITTINYRVGIFNDSNEHLSIFNSGNVTIGTTTDVPSSILTLESTTKGFLPPRMTTAQRDAITSPAAGLVIYNTTDNKHQGYDGSTWNNFY